MKRGPSGPPRYPVDSCGCMGGHRNVLLKQRQLRMTRQRRLILEELRRVNDHPSADQIYERVRRHLPRISLGTVYRNLEVLSELGEIQTLELGCSLKRFDGTPHDHYHIRCLHCDRLEDAPVAVVDGMETDLAEKTGFQVFGHKLEFIGICPDCSRSRTAPTPPSVS